MATVPALVHQNLSVMHHHTEGGLFLGTSSLSGRYWAGSLRFYDKAESAPQVEFCSARTELEGGINDFELISDTKVFVGLDTGAVQIWELSAERAELTRRFVALEHDDLVTSVSVNSNQSIAASASQDRRIKIWDINDLACMNTYKAHNSSVLDVSFHPVEPDIFLSCSMDGQVLMWDLRKPKPATILDVSSSTCLPTCLTWKSDSTDQVFVGRQDGSVSFHDIKTGSRAPVSVSVHERKVNRIRSAPHRPEWVASVSDDCSVCVTSFSETAGSVIFRNGEHKDFVQGLSWSPVNQHLYTCGWDFKVQGLEVVPNVISSPARSEAMDLDVADAPPENMDTFHGSARQMAMVGAGN